MVQGTVMRGRSAGQALKRARVTLRRVTTVSALPTAARAGLQGGGAATTQAVTDDTGRFVFNGVEPGDYRIAADRDGFLHQEYGQRSTSGQGRVITVFCRPGR